MDVIMNNLVQSLLTNIKPFCFFIQILSQCTEHTMKHLCIYMKYVIFGERYRVTTRKISNNDVTCNSCINRLNGWTPGVMRIILSFGINTNVYCVWMLCLLCYVHLWVSNWLTHWQSDTFNMNKSRNGNRSNWIWTLQKNCIIFTGNLKRFAHQAQLRNSYLFFLFFFFDSFVQNWVDIIAAYPAIINIQKGKKKCQAIVCTMNRIVWNFRTILLIYHRHVNNHEYREMPLEYRTYNG